MWLRERYLINHISQVAMKGEEIMTNLEMNQMLNEYAYLTAQLESIKKAQDELKETIITKMAETGIEKIDDGEKSLSLVNKQTVKIKNEANVIAHLKESGMAKLVKEKVDTTGFNNLVKMNTTLLESVQNDYEVNKITTLMFKKK